MKKIWQSELSSFNKVITHNTYAIPVLTNTVRIIDWTIEEVKEIDVRTRKQLTANGNFHQNGDVDKLYFYLTINSNCSNIIKFVYEQEQQNIIWIQQKLLECYNVEHDETSTPKYLSKQFMKADLTVQKEKYIYSKSDAWVLREGN